MRQRLVWFALTVLVVVILVTTVWPRVTPGNASGGSGAAPDAWFDIAFTTPPDGSASPTCAPRCLDTRLVTLIDSAQRSIDVAAYDFDLRNVAEAMARAKGRGVAVRMVTDSDTVGNLRDERIQAAIRIVRTAAIPIVEDGRRPIMHHKFVVVDATTVLTGSWNLTEGDTFRLDNNAVIFRNPDLAANFTAEFEEMFVRHRFGPKKTNSVAHPRVQIGSATVETYFASARDPSVPLREVIGRATQKIDFLAFSFTHNGIGDAVIARARAGAKVRGVFERTGSETKYSEFRRLREAGLDVLQDGNRYVMHHKVFIIDGTTTAFGSFNFSDNASTDNDENLVIVTDPAFARLFTTEVDRVIAVARRAPGR